MGEFSHGGIDKKKIKQIMLATPDLVPTARGILQDGFACPGFRERQYMTYESNVPFVLRYMIDNDIVGGFFYLSCREEEERKSFITKKKKKKKSQLVRVAKDGVLCSAKPPDGFKVPDRSRRCLQQHGEPPYDDQQMDGDCSFEDLVVRH